MTNRQTDTGNAVFVFLYIVDLQIAICLPGLYWRDTMNWNHIPYVYSHTWPINWILISDILPEVIKCLLKKVKCKH